MSPINETGTPVVLVTGAAKRVGAAIARALHASGWNVVIHYRASGGDARALEKELNRARADSAASLRANLLDLRAVDKLAVEAHARWGRLDALVNNASSYYKTPLAELTEEQYEDLTGSNLKAPLFLTRACAKLMKQGSVVNIADIHAALPMKHYAVYCAAKAGLVSLTESLARELAPRIRVNTVSPGTIDTPMIHELLKEYREAFLAGTPLGRLGTGREVADAILFLCSDRARFITGQTIHINGGAHIGG
jgi:pteridine reductase